MIKIYTLLLFSMMLLSACQTYQEHSPFVAPADAYVIKATFKHFVISRDVINPVVTNSEITNPSAISRANTLNIDNPTVSNHNAGDQVEPSARLHVYIEGDGIPFLNRFLIAKDPSPSNPLMLKLMALDKGNRLYLGRPCYFTRSLIAMDDSHCNSALWTSERYSEAVVESMVIALRHYLRSRPHDNVTLIGHSGGGTLAMLMAARMKEVDQVVTLAANLDVQAWTRLHVYAPLKQSLSPADLPVSALPAHQIHVVGERDDNVPPELNRDFFNRMGQTPLRIKGADHICCWVSHWNTLLEDIDRQIQP